MYIDTHCHLTCDELYEKAEELIANAKESGIETIMIMCTSVEELDRALELKEKYPDLFKVAFGWFPEEARDFDPEKLEVLEAVCKEGKIDVLGEIGLDYYWDKSYKDKQKDLFIKQIEIANKYDLPISIHMRDASRDTMDILKEHSKTSIIFHCFSGSKEIMKEVLKMNALISFAGPITFKNNRVGVENVLECPLDRILSETDAPYLAPVPKRGKRNEPAFVAFTADKIAEIKDLPVEMVTAQIRENFKNLFAPR